MGETMSQISVGANEGPRTFASAIVICLNQYVKFSGRAPRSEYWYFVLFTVIVSIVANIIDAVIFGVAQGVFSVIASLALFLPRLAVSVPRLHDTDPSCLLRASVLVTVIALLN